MTTLILLTVLTAPQPPATTGAQAPGAPCTPANVIGTWQFMAESRTFPGTTPYKHVTPTHFFIVRPDAEGMVAAGHGGTYSVVDGTYTEHVLQAISERVGGLRGRSFSFACRMEGDVWYTTLGEGDDPITERWRRVPAGRP